MKRSISAFKALAVISVFSIGCESGKKSGGSSAPPPSPFPSAQPIVQTSPAPIVDTSPAPALEITKEQCNSQGKVWIPTIKKADTQETVPAHCDEPLAQGFNCTNQGIIDKFGALSKDNALQNKIKEFDGYELYNCGQKTDKVMRFHYIQQSADGLTKYKWFEVTQT